LRVRGREIRGGRRRGKAYGTGKVKEKKEGGNPQGMEKEKP
jgi:hypothetical protein